jgi:hypothetical protein
VFLGLLHQVYAAVDGYFLFSVFLLQWNVSMKPTENEVINVNITDVTDFVFRSSFLQPPYGCGFLICDFLIGVKHVC